MTDRPHHRTGPPSGGAASAGTARPAGKRRSRRRHPAKGARISAAALGASTMLGLVGAMGYAHHASPSPAPTSPQANGQPQLPILIQTDRSASSTTTPEIRPDVRPSATPATTPAGSTSGSH